MVMLIIQPTSYIFFHTKAFMEYLQQDSMKKIITFVFLTICLHTYGQRSQKSWNNHINYKQDLAKVRQKSLRKNLAKRFENINQNNATNMKNARRMAGLPAGISFVNGMNLAWINFGRDTGVDPFNSNQYYHPNLQKFGAAMDLVKNNGGNVIRWWYHTNGSTNPVFDGNQKVKTNPGFFHQDVKKILDLAQSKGLKVQICLWSFDMLKDQWGVDAAANKKLLTQKSHTDAYINNALIPLVQFIGNHPGLYAWEIFNEPEGMTNDYASHWPGFKERVTMPDIQRFINRTAGAIRRAQPNAKITNGALGMLTNVEDAAKGFWNAYSDTNLKQQGGDNQGYLDFYNIHYYAWARSKGSPFHTDYNPNKIDKAAVIGEYYPDNLSFGQQGGDNDHKLAIIKAQDLGVQLIDRGWAGSLVWSWTDRSTPGEKNRMATIMRETSKRIKPTNQVIANGTYYFGSVTNNQRMYDAGNTVKRAKMANPSNHNNQKWTITHLGNNVYTIKNKATGEFLEVSNAICKDRARVSTWKHANADHMKWKIEKHGNLYELKPIYCLTRALDRDFGNTTRSGNVHLYKDVNNQNQRWKITKVSNARSTVNEITFDQVVSVYPNPVSHELHLKGVQIGDELVIRDQLGQEVYHVTLQTKGQSLPVDHLAEGVYFLSVKGKTLRLIKK